MAAEADATPNPTHRQRLLDALAESIRERGLQRTQITDIVRIARTSRRTFYECFADKESCFLELIDASREAVQAEMLAAVDPTAPWTTQVDQAVDTFLCALGSDPALTVTISRELPALGMRGYVYQRESTEQYARLVVGLTESAEMQRADIPPVSLEAAVMIVGGISELIDRATLRDERPESAGPTIKRVVKAILDPTRQLAAAPARPRKRAAAKAPASPGAKARAAR
jgi:AcrR family transcriptional regulator